MMMPEHPERFMEGIEGGLFSFSLEKSGRGRSCGKQRWRQQLAFFRFVGTSSHFSRFKTFDNCFVCSGQACLYYLTPSVDLHVYMPGPFHNPMCSSAPL